MQTPLPLFPIGQPRGLSAAAEASMEKGIVLFILLLLILLSIECEGDGNPVQSAAIDTIILIGVAIIFWANAATCPATANPQPGGRCSGKRCEEKDAVAKEAGSPEEPGEPASPEVQEPSI